MKMIPAGNADILGYPQYSRNCNLGCKYRYLAPVPNLAAVQIFLNLGPVQPSEIDFTMLDICSNKTTELESNCFIIAFNGSYWYAVYRSFTTDTVYDSYIIFAHVTYTDDSEKSFISEQYRNANPCDNLVKVSVCYPTNWNAEDINGIYIGGPATGFPVSGKSAVFYQHTFWTELGEIIETQNKITFTSNQYKNFNSSLNRLWEFRPEFVPGWYKDYLLSVYFRGNIFINDVAKFVTDLAFDHIDEGQDLWKPYAVLGQLFKGGFGCADNTCIDDCICLPVVIPAITFDNAQSGVVYTKIIPIAGSLALTISGITKPAWITTFEMDGSNLIISGTPADGDIGGPAEIAFTITNDCSDEEYDSGDGGITVDAHSDETPTAILTFGFVNAGGSFLQFIATLSTPIDANINITRYYSDGFPATPCTGGTAVSSAQMNKSINIPAGSTGTGTTPSIVSGTWAAASHYNIYNVIVNSFPHLDGNVIMIGSYLVTLVIPDCV